MLSKKLSTKNPLVYCKKNIISRNNNNNYIIKKIILK